MKISLGKRPVLLAFATLSTLLSWPLASATKAREAEQLRELEPGMQWTYRVTGHITPPGMSQPMPLEGTIEIAITEAELNGETRLALNVVQKLLPPPDPEGEEAVPPASPPAHATPPAGDAPSFFGAGTAPALVFYIRQDADDGDLHIVADTGRPGGAIRLAEGDGVLFIPGQWHASAGFRDTVHWDDGTSAEIWLEVEGREDIETPLGVISSWRAPNGSIESNGTVIRGVDWWVPALGQPSRFDVATETAEGAKISIDAVLESTNVEF